MPIAPAASTVRLVDNAQSCLSHRIVAEQAVVTGRDSRAEIIVGGDPVRQAARPGKAAVEGADADMGDARGQRRPVVRRFLEPRKEAG
ncbi:MULTISPECIES: hypothetical protein [unclassified Mesorhizobium]|uniref:hypothetical protein n=1 Tax=unclassified Mesorhizobium TaxID=325217 RepID=UPI00167776B1|nr:MULTISPECIES: hypothetical protein [unclassified Mesorhizobium]